MNFNIDKRFSILFGLILLMNLSVFGQKDLYQEQVEESGRIKWGFVNKRGKEVIPFVYDSIFFDFKQNVAGVGKWINDTLQAGVISHKNKVIIPFKFKEISSKNNFLLAVDHSNFLGLFDRQGQLIEEPAYKKIQFNDSTLTLDNYPEWKIFDGKGAVLSVAEVDSTNYEDGSIFGYRNGVVYELLSIKSKGIFVKNGVDCPGNKLLPDSILPTLDSVLVNYDSLVCFSEDFIGVGGDGYFGFLDTSGKIRISLQYESIKAFSEGLAPVKIMNKWAYINRNEDFVIQPEFEDADRFCGNAALVKKDGKYNFIDKNGRLRNSEGYHRVYRNNYGNWVVSIDSKFGLVNSEGEEIIIPKYESLTDYGNGFVKVEKHNLFGVLDYNQNIIVPLRFNKILGISEAIFFAGNPGKSKVLKFESTSK